MGPTHFGHHYRCSVKLEMAIFWMGMETKRRAQLRCCYHWFWAVFFKNVGHNLQKQNQVTKHPTPSMPSSCPRRRIGRRTELANLLHYDTEEGEGDEILGVVITARIESSDTLSTLVLHKILWLSVNQFFLICKEKPFTDTSCLCRCRPPCSLWQQCPLHFDGTWHIGIV